MKTHKLRTPIAFDYKKEFWIEEDGFEPEQWTATEYEAEYEQWLCFNEEGETRVIPAYHLSNPRIYF